METILAIANDPAVRAIVEVAGLILAADVIVAVIVAAKDGNFSRKYVAEFVGGHVLGRFLPIVALAVLASGLGAALAGVSGVPMDLSVLASGLWVGAWASLAAYALETTKSLQDSAKGITLGTPPKP